MGALSEISAFLIVIKLDTILIRIILSEHIIDNLVVIFVPRMVFQNFYNVLAVF